MTRAGEDFLDVSQRRNRQNRTDTLKTSSPEGALKPQPAGPRITRYLTGHSQPEYVRNSHDSAGRRQLDVNKQHTPPHSKKPEPPRAVANVQVGDTGASGESGASVVLEGGGSGRRGAGQGDRAHAERAPESQHRTAGVTNHSRGSQLPE